MTTTPLGTTLRHIQRLFDDGTVTGLADSQLLARFVAERDEASFAAIVARHGGMVLAVCRGVLRDPNDVEDAFQATFLTLFRKGASLWVGDSLGGWLHRVAYRVALQANADAQRRRDIEREAAAEAARRDVPTGPIDELRRALHAEIDRLPERLRLPLVLCDLEGMTRGQAADRLRWTDGAVRGRLAKARALLRDRLTRRGMALAPAALGAVLASEATAAVPEAWVTSAFQAIARPTSGLAAVALATRVARALSLALGKSLIATLAAVAMVAGATVATLVLATSAGRSPAPRSASAAPNPPPVQAQTAPGEPKAESQSFRGRLVDPKGQPVAGAPVYFFPSLDRSASHSPRATTGPDGRFAFEVPNSDFRRIDLDWRGRLPVMAFAPGFGFATAPSSEATMGREPTLRLVEDLPIEGRVLDLEGRPIAGAQVVVTSTRIPGGGGLDRWLAAAAAGEGMYDTLLPKYLRNGLYVPDPTRGPIPPVTTDAQGRFRLAGLGRERLVELRIQGTETRLTEAHVMTRESGQSTFPRDPRSLLTRFTVYGHRPQVVPSPGRPIRGVVRDSKSGAPLAGIRVLSYQFSDDRIGNNMLLSTTTDAEGRYTLLGMPRGPENEIAAIGPEGSPYLPVRLKVADPPGLGPVACDVAMTRGIVVEGRVVDAATGRPVRASVSYHARADNPHLADAPGLRAIRPHSYEFQASVDPEGQFRCPALPGRGLIMVEALSQEYPEVAPADKPNGAEYIPNALALAQAVLKVDLAEGRPPAPLEFKLDAQLSIPGEILDPDGNPLAGALIYNLGNLGAWSSRPLVGATFKVLAMRKEAKVEATATQASQPERTLVFQHEGRKLAGWRDIAHGEASPVRVTLAPWGVVTGRILDEDNNPRADVAIEAKVIGKPRKGGGVIEHRPERLLTGSDGRFTVEGLAPGLPYRLVVGRNQPGVPQGIIQVPPTKPGEIRDLGDITPGAHGAGKP